MTNTGTPQQPPVSKWLGTWVRDERYWRDISTRVFGQWIATGVIALGALVLAQIVGLLPGLNLAHWLNVASFYSFVTGLLLFVVGIGFYAGDQHSVGRAFGILGLVLAVIVTVGLVTWAAAISPAAAVAATRPSPAATSATPAP